MVYRVYIHTRQVEEYGRPRWELNLQQWQRQVSEFCERHLRDNTCFWEGKIEFHKIFPLPPPSPLPRFPIHTQMNFFPDISEIFPDLSKLFPPNKIFHIPIKIFSQTLQNLIINETTFRKFSQYCLQHIQLRFSNNIWPFFTKVVSLLLWFLQPWLSTTNDFYRNYQELGGGGVRSKKYFGGEFPPWHHH